MKILNFKLEPLRCNSAELNQILNYKRAFTLIELIVVIVITVILSGIILFSVTQYIAKGKDANIAGNLAVLIPSGEVYYNSNNNSYQNFCGSSVAVNAFSQMPSGTVYHCNVEPTYYQAWAACARKFTNSSNAYCIDSRGMKEDILNSSCTATLYSCP